MKIVQKKIENLFTCPCCGYKTLSEQPPGTFEICQICWWEDDNIQFDDPDYIGGANGDSLRMCQRKFYKVDEHKKLIFENLGKHPDQKWYEVDENWKPLDE